MQKASYTNVQTATGGQGKYPLSTQTLDFIQQQILLLQEMVAISGGKVIIREPDGTNAGLLNLNGEILPLAPTPIRTAAVKYIVVTTAKSNILADGETYLEARTMRTAKYSSTASGSECYALGDFSALTTNATLAELVRNMPSTVLNYLSDILDSKLDRLTLNGATQAQLDALKKPCVVNCTNSVKQCEVTNYVLTVRCAGSVVEQELKTPAGQEYYRIFSSNRWTAWVATSDDMHIEVKTVGSTVYVRHGILPADAKIIFLRKKKRSAWRSTGGQNAYTKNKGKRVRRQKKLQYVHYKGVVLSKGEPGKWYVPKCIEVQNRAADGNLIDRELSSIAGQLVREGNTTTNGYKVIKLAGVRKFLTKDAQASARRFKTTGYINVAVQVAKLNKKGGKDAGGELACMKFRVQPKKVYVFGSGSGSNGRYTWTYVKTFSVV